MNKKFAGFTSVQLKYTAMFFMLLDHIGAVVLAPMLIYSENSFSPLYTFLRSAGRIAFPIFCFQLAEGFFHTKNRKWYFARLLMFALVSETPFDIAFGGKMYYPLYQNIFFTLSIGFLCIWALDACKSHVKNYILQILVSAAIIFAGMALAGFLHTDYKYGGVLAVTAAYLFRNSLNKGEAWKNRCIQACAIYAALMFYSPSFEIAAVFAIPLIAIYNGKLIGEPKEGKKHTSVHKWLPYLFYPLHLLALSMIRAVFLSVS